METLLHYSDDLADKHANHFWCYVQLIQLLHLVFL